MKLLVGNGKLLEVRDVGPVIYTLTPGPGGIPVKYHGTRLHEDDDARVILRDLLDSGLYTASKPDAA